MARNMNIENLNKNDLVPNQISELIDRFKESLVIIKNKKTNSFKSSSI